VVQQVLVDLVVVEDQVDPKDTVVVVDLEDQVDLLVAVDQVVKVDLEDIMVTRDLKDMLDQDHMEEDGIIRLDL